MSHSTKPESNPLAARTLQLVTNVVLNFSEEQNRKNHKAIDFFIDKVRLRAGDDFGSKIIQALAKARIAVVLISKEALDRSSWVHFEAGVMFWRSQFDPKVRMLYVLIDPVEGSDCHRVFSPQQSDRFLYLQFNGTNEADFSARISEFLNENVGTGECLIDPAYAYVRDFMEASGKLAAENFLETYDRSASETMPWTDPIDGVSIVLVTTPVTDRTLRAFEDYIHVLVRKDPAIKIAEHLKLQTTPLEYVSRLRSILIDPSGAPKSAPTITALSGTPDLVDYHLMRVFEKRSRFTWYCVPKQVYDLSIPALRTILERGSIKQSVTLQRHGKRRFADDILDEARRHRSVIVSLAYNGTIETDLNIFWSEQFHGLPVHLFLHTTATEVPADADHSGGMPDHQRAEQWSITKVWQKFFRGQTQPSPDLAPASRAPDIPIHRLHFLSDSDELEQRLLISRIDNALDRLIGRPTEVLVDLR